VGRHDRRHRIPSGFRSIRDILTAVLGAAGIVHESLLSSQERPTLLIIYAGLLGLPLVLRESERDDKPPKGPRRGRDEGDADGEG
jgi:hypothetical protein